MSVRDLAPGETRPVRIGFDTDLWVLAPEHRWVLVVDTVDERYFSRHPLGADVSLISGPGSPARLDLPLVVR